MRRQKGSWSLQFSVTENILTQPVGNIVPTSIIRSREEILTQKEEWGLYQNASLFFSPPFRSDSFTIEDRRPFVGLGKQGG